jgi:sirohydrochlorin ferrochelatase
VNLELVGWIGIGMLIAAVLAIVIEGVVAALWSLRIAKAALLLSERLESERAEIEADVAKLRSALEEMRRLWQPYRRALRWVQHPLVIALFASYRRRRMGVRL